jgi:hypothetical protein
VGLEPMQWLQAGTSGTAEEHWPGFSPSDWTWVRPSESLGNVNWITLVKKPKEESTFAMSLRSCQKWPYEVHKLCH